MRLAFSLWLAFFALLAAPRHCHARRPPPPPAAEQVLRVLARVAGNVRHTAYKPVLRVDERRGRYEFDCSAMAGWVLAQTAPKARRSLQRARPLARDFYQAIADAPTERPQRGWRRIDRIADAQAGDVLAWKRPLWFRSRNTGHVAFVMAAPEPVPGGYLVRIADATSLPHGDDTRTPESGGGFGYGTLLVTTDPATGQGKGYGWHGRRSLDNGWVIETPIVIGRVSR